MAIVEWQSGKFAGIASDGTALQYMADGTVGPLKPSSQKWTYDPTTHALDVIERRKEDIRKARNFVHRHCLRRMNSVYEVPARFESAGHIPVSENAFMIMCGREGVSVQLAASFANAGESASCLAVCYCCLSENIDVAKYCRTCGRDMKATLSARFAQADRYGETLVLPISNPSLRAAAKRACEWSMASAPDNGDFVFMNVGKPPRRNIVARAWRWLTRRK